EYRSGPREPRALEIQLVGKSLHAVVRLDNGRGGEGVRLDDVGTGEEILEMDVADGVRLGEDKKVVVAANVPMPVLEPLTAMARLVELQRLDHRAHGAVEDQDALAGGGAQRCADVVAARKLCRVGFLIGHVRGLD